MSAKLLLWIDESVPAGMLVEKQVLAGSEVNPTPPSAFYSCSQETFDAMPDEEKQRFNAKPLPEQVRVWREAFRLKVEEKDLVPQDPDEDYKTITFG